MNNFDKTYITLTEVYNERNDNKIVHEDYPQFSKYQFDIIKRLRKAEKSLYYLYEQWFQNVNYKGLEKIKPIDLPDDIKMILNKLYHFSKGEYKDSFNLGNNHTGLLISAIMCQLLFDPKDYYGNGQDYIKQLIKDGFDSVTEEDFAEFVEDKIISNRSEMRGLTFNLNSFDAIRLIQKLN